MTWRERMLLQLPSVLVLAVVAGGVAAVANHYWRKGLYVVGLGLVIGAVLRALLPTRRVGLLAVRSRVMDVVVLGSLGGAIGVLAAVIPPVLV